jgi:CheY-like chemotaxis protein
LGSVGCALNACDGNPMTRKKILLVDDSKTMILMEQLILSTGPFEVLVAKDGQEGLEVAAKERPDLIVMDVEMPRLSGVEACRRLRKQPETASTPVILLTSLDEAGDVRHGRDAGCTDYLTKPIKAAELLSKVKSHLGL